MPLMLAHYIMCIQFDGIIDQLPESILDFQNLHILHWAGTHMLTCAFRCSRSRAPLNAHTHASEMEWIVPESTRLTFPNNLIAIENHWTRTNWEYWISFHVSVSFQTTAFAGLCKCYIAAELEKEWTRWSVYGIYRFFSFGFFAEDGLRRTRSDEHHAGLVAFAAARRWA